MDLLDFYRGTLSARRLGVLIRQLPVEAALVRALNEGRTPWGNLEHLLADNWVLTKQLLQAQTGERIRAQDHPVRAAAEEKKRAAAKRARVAELKATFQKRKQTYGLG